MNTSALTQAMKVSISEVLEQMFFLPIDFAAPEKESADLAAPDDGSIIAKLGFNGSPSGTFILRIPVALAQSIAADFLGTEPQRLSGDQVTGTVMEMVNMLAGGALSNYDHQALFDLQIPELITIDEMCALTEEAPDHIMMWIQTAEDRMRFELILQ